MARISNEEIIKAYRDTGSIWKAGKILGIGGQSVHYRLKNLGITLSNQAWSKEELDELAELAGHHTITEISSKLGRPYNGVAMKISRLGLGVRYGNNQKRKPPRTEKYYKANVLAYIEELKNSDISLRQLAAKHNLSLEKLVRAFQTFDNEFWMQYTKDKAVLPLTNCPYCNSAFYPLSKKQIYCSRKCGDESRTDASYFGGRRRETVGLAERICQLCGRKNVKGLSSHHMIGKENDPDNEHLVALCPGCHQIVTLLGGRSFSGDPEVWEALIQLAMIRKLGHDSNIGGVYVSVDLEIISKDKLNLWEEEI